jgi:hypothetical protein
MSTQNLVELYSRLAGKYHVSARVIEVLADMIQRTKGEEARFEIPELGGKGIWKPKQGAIMGNGFNEALNKRATELCNEIAGQLQDKDRDETTVLNSLDETMAMSPIVAEAPVLGSWWPPHLGDSPELTGNAGTSRYAYFAAKDRLVIQSNLRNRLFDTTGFVVLSVAPGRSAGFFNMVVTTDKSQLTIMELKEVSK